MPAITVTDLNNATIDVQHIAAIANSLSNTATDRMGNTKLTVAGAINEMKAFNYRGAFSTGAVYAIKDVYTYSGIAYAVVVAHTSTTVAADISAGKTIVYQGLTSSDLTYNNRRNATLVASAMLKIRAGTAKIACQGDSLTYGHDSVSPGTIPAVSPHVFPHVPTPYPEKLESTLNTIYSTAGIQVVNLGFSGHTAKDGYEYWTNPGADLAFIMYGINDAKVTGITLDEYTFYISAIIEQYNSWGCGVALLTSTSIGQGYGDTPVESYRAASAALASKYNCPLFKADVVGQNNAFADIHSDSVHFNQVGYTLLANSLAAFITAGGLGENVVTVAAEKTLLFGLESAAVTNGSAFTNPASIVSQGYILALDEGTNERATIAFYLDADSAYVSLVGRLSVGSTISIDQDSIRSSITRKGFSAVTSSNYTIQTNNLQTEPTNDLFLGQVVGRGWHSVSITAPSIASSTPAYINALRIAPRSQDDCYASVFNVSRKSFSLYDPVPQYVGGLLPASNTAVFALPGSLFASMFIKTSYYYMSAFARFTICHTRAGIASYTEYIVRPNSATTLGVTLISSSGADPVTISSVTSTSILDYPGGTVTINLVRPLAGYMEMRIDVPDVPQLLNAALF